ncbi:MAG: DUF5856 family protein [Alphaproteobacteria bacterium]|nr:DUF5856 family protein [Alphaproteobacteria bacterium]
MYELMQRLIAFKYSCKIHHWSTNNYAMHLLFDRLTEQVDDWADAIAERYFMAEDNKRIFKSDILNPKYIKDDLIKMCEDIISYIERALETQELNEGLVSLLTDMESGLLNKLALVRLK